MSDPTPDSTTEPADDFWAKFERGRERVIAAHNAHAQECAEIAKTDPLRAFVQYTMGAPCYADLAFADFGYETDPEMAKEIERIEREGVFHVDTIEP